MEFRRYQHIERFGREEVEDINIGEVFVFYKIDGTNSSCWLKEGELKAGSRNRELTLDNDNGGFYAHILQDKRILAYLNKYPTHRLFGEFLIPHTLKTYRDDAWRKFYIFDVCVDKEDDLEYLPYNNYKDKLEEFGLEYIPPLAIIKNPTEEQLYKLLDKTGQFLIEDGKGKGEGFVIKNFNYYNKYGRQTWAKIVCNEFKEKHHKSMGCPEMNGELTIEERIVDELCTSEFIEKEYAKLVLKNDGFDSKLIPQLLGIIYHEFIVEESWNMIKKYKNPIINYKKLNQFLIKKIKEVKKEIF